MAGGIGTLANLVGKVNADNELVVSATVAASGGAIADGVTDSLKATVLDLVASNPLTVGIVDGNGDQITSFGGGTQYTEDAAAAANPVGTAVILVRADARGTGVVSADGDNVAQRGNDRGEAYVLDTDLNTAVGTATTAAVSGDNNGSAVAHLRGINTNLAAVLDLANGRVIVDGSEVTQPVSDAGGSLTIDNAALSVVGGGVEATALRVTVASDSTGVLSVDDNGGSLTVDGTVAATQSGTWTVQPGNTPNTSPWLTTQTPATSGGLTIFRSIDLDETEEEIKATAGQVFGWFLFNAAASTRFVKFYNATAANVTVGTTTPVLTMPIPAGSAANVQFSNGIAFDTAITAAATTGVADADTGAPSANDVIVNIFYK
jgi:hypothetical protein